MTGPVLSFDNVIFRYGNTPVLDGFSVDIPRGSITCLMGPSGCGKSTLIALAAGLLRPESGVLRRAEGCRTAPMFQDPLLLPWRDALSNVAFGLKAEPIPAAERVERARTALEETGLSGAELCKLPRQLSGGMQQRVALARALAVAPDLLLLDEPFRALDPPLARRMHARVRHAIEERHATALIVTHDTREAVRIADRVVLLSTAPGRIRALREFPDRPGNRTAVEIAELAEELDALADSGPRDQGSSSGGSKVMKSRYAE
ncbi:ABC transporter ATP-binding protein [Aliiruegeria sabulilitoris]|uniref:ABC transporter ATP-binding protein n=1 Tax=Aliiruegeria sabulilitoris TaxID=1510458 RepID=UPI000829D849|nr:ATP-binding cassette domain-containing protein [Aliiruegeria sabulilitoris]NDR57655.1 ATP-binding cassette domain-containing protein [Pseudoruegeria sp. M32A2M]